jgi:hypothetical protein
MFFEASGQDDKAEEAYKDVLASNPVDEAAMKRLASAFLCSAEQLSPGGGRHA